MKDDNWNLLHMRGGITTLKAARNRKALPSTRVEYRVGGIDVTDTVDAYIDSGLLMRGADNVLILTDRGQSLLKEYEDIMIEDTSEPEYLGCDPT